MDDELIAHACRNCRDIRATHHVPDACFQCGARFDKGAGVALVRLALDVETIGGTLRVAPAYRVDFVGTWRPEERVYLERVFGQHCAAPAISHITPRTPTRSDSSSD
jgi:hypothetical protein